MGWAEEWRPAAAMPVLRLRAALLAELRRFFAARGVMEVETPMLAHAGAPEPQLQNLRTRLNLPGASVGTWMYLQTSPELHMKRLLAAGSGPIYQVARVFRDGERGRLHHPEFTLVEWYRPGFDHHLLMDEIGQLLAALLGSGPGERLSYAEAFARHAGIDPFHASAQALREHCTALGLMPGSVDDRDQHLDFILSRQVGPRLGMQAPCFLYDFPDSQAALARVRPGRPPVAERFEVFYRGIELANGFHELRDPRTQRRRLEQACDKRRQAGTGDGVPDERFLAALAYGLPDCSGCAVGLDRVLMIRAGLDDISQALAFPVEIA